MAQSQAAPAATVWPDFSKSVVPTTFDTKESWPYLLDHIGRDDLSKKLYEQVEALPRARMAGSPDEAELLRWLLDLMGAKKVIELGVFRGTTTLALARGVGPDGTVYAFDITDEYLVEGRKTWEAAGVTSRIKLQLGPALSFLEPMLQEHANTVDLVFIDADKSNQDNYYELALKLVRPGGVIAVDNVLWHGRPALPVDPKDVESNIIRDSNTKIRSDPRVRAVMLGIADGVYLCKKV